MKKTVASISVGSLCFLLAACGGGGGGSGGGSSTAPTLNLNAAYASLIQNGDSALYTLSGDCTGTSSQTSLPAYNAQNDETPAVSVLAVQDIQFDTLSTASQASSTCTQVFNSNNGEVNSTFYSPTDQTVVNKGGSTYWQVYSAQTAAPTSVTAGTSGTLYTWKNYDGASSTTGAPVSTGTFSYSVAADTATTLLVTFTDTGTDATGKLAYTYSKTYRLNANNTLSNLSFALNAKANSPIGAALSVTGTATSAPTLNAQAAQQAWLTTGGTNVFRVFNSDGTQCTPTVSITQAALASTGGTTSRQVSYAKNSTTSFAPQTVTGSGNCSNFSLPQSEESFFDANYALVQQTTNNGSSTSTNVNAASTPWPNAVTIGSTGQLYTYSRYRNNDSNAFATGNAIYFVGALTPTKLALFEVTTKNYSSGGSPARNIFVNSLDTTNTIAPVYGYLNDSGNTFTLMP